MPGSARCASCSSRSRARPTSFFDLLPPLFRSSVSLCALSYRRPFSHPTLVPSLVAVCPLAPPLAHEPLARSRPLVLSQCLPCNLDVSSQSALLRSSGREGAGEPFADGASTSSSARRRSLRCGRRYSPSLLLDGHLRATKRRSETVQAAREVRAPTTWACSTLNLLSRADSSFETSFLGSRACLMDLDWSILSEREPNGPE